MWNAERWEGETGRKIGGRKKRRGVGRTKGGERGNQGAGLLWDCLVRVVS
jgi:hypothetical protein